MAAGSAAETRFLARQVISRGQVVGQSYGGPEGGRGFLWENGKTTDLNTLANNEGGMYLLYAEGINDRGDSRSLLRWGVGLPAH